MKRIFRTKAKGAETGPQNGVQVIFLDIDGVLNSSRTCAAFDGFPHDFGPAHRAKFDEVAVTLLRQLCAARSISIVVSSTWREQFTWCEIGDALDLPTIGQTPMLEACRGDEIAAWLAAHPEVQQYAILDDIDQMLPEQTPRFVCTDPDEGLTFKSFHQLCAVFNTTPYRVLQTLHKTEKLEHGQGEPEEEAAAVE